MTETYTSGVWTVKPGEEEAFVSEWRNFAGWANSFSGSGELRLIRDVDSPGSYMSFAPWESFEAQKAWKDEPEFRDRIMRVRSHCEDFQPAVFELVAQVP